MYVNKVTQWSIALIVVLCIASAAYWSLGFGGAAATGSTEPLVNGLYAMQNRWKIGQMYLRVQPGTGRMVDVSSLMLLNSGLLGNIEKSPPIAEDTTVITQQLPAGGDMSDARWTIGPLVASSPRYFIGEQGEGTETPDQTDWCCGPGIPRVQGFGPSPATLEEIVDSAKSNFLASDNANGGRAVLSNLLGRPVDVLVILICAWLFIRTASGAVSLSAVHVSAEQAWYQTEYFRFFSSAFAHGGIMHIGFNLSTLYTVGQVEPGYGSIVYLTYTIAMVLLCGTIASLISIALARRLAGAGAGEDATAGAQRILQPAVGYSAVLFAWLVVATSQRESYCPVPMAPGLCLPTWRVPVPFSGGVTIPVNLAPFLSLAFIQLFIRRASFVGHLAGIVAGYPLSWGALSWMSLPMLTHLVLLLGALHAAAVWHGKEASRRGVLWASNGWTGPCAQCMGVCSRCTPGQLQNQGNDGAPAAAQPQLQLQQHQQQQEEEGDVTAARDRAAAVGGIGWFWRESGALAGAGGGGSAMQESGGRFTGVGGTAGGEQVWVTPRSDIRVIDPAGDRPGAKLVPILLVAGLGCKVIGLLLRVAVFDWRSIIAELAGCAAAWIAISGIAQRLAAPPALPAPQPRRSGASRITPHSHAVSGLPVEGGTSSSQRDPDAESAGLLPADGAADRAPGPRQAASAGSRLEAVLRAITSCLPNLSVLRSPWRLVGWMHDLARRNGCLPGISAEWACVCLGLAAGLDLINSSGTSASMVVLQDVYRQLGATWAGIAAGWCAVCLSLASACLLLGAFVAVYSLSRFTAIEVGIATLYRVFLGSGADQANGASAYEGQAVEAPRWLVGSRTVIVGGVATSVDRDGTRRVNLGESMSGQVDPEAYDARTMAEVAEDAELGTRRQASGRAPDGAAAPWQRNVGSAGGQGQGSRDPVLDRMLGVNPASPDRADASSNGTGGASAAQGHRVGGEVPASSSAAQSATDRRAARAAALDARRLAASRVGRAGVDNGIQEKTPNLPAGRRDQQASTRLGNSDRTGK